MGRISDGGRADRSTAGGARQAGGAVGHLLPRLRRCGRGCKSSSAAPRCDTETAARSAGLLLAPPLFQLALDGNAHSVTRGGLAVIFRRAAIEFGPQMLDMSGRHTGFSGRCAALGLSGDYCWGKAGVPQRCTCIQVIQCINTQWILRIALFPQRACSLYGRSANVWCRLSPLFACCWALAHGEQPAASRSISTKASVLRRGVECPPTRLSVG